jgi:hypothetical protein
LEQLDNYYLVVYTCKKYRKGYRMAKIKGMKLTINLKTALIVGGIVAAVGIVIGYFIFARQGSDGYIPVNAVLGLSSDNFWKDLGNSIRAKTLEVVRLKIIISCIIGFDIGFFLGGMFKK